MTTEAATLADDMLEGAEAIAAFLGPTWTAGRVRTAKYRGELPLRSRPGMRIYAFKSELRAFLADPGALPEAFRSTP